MNSTPVNLILGQSYLHILSYGLVLWVLFVAVADGYLIRQLRKALRSERARFRKSGLGLGDLEEMVHPVACGLRHGPAGIGVPSPIPISISRLSTPPLRRQVD